jgi:hypothetical protein
VPLWRDIGPGATAQRLQVIAAAYGGPTPIRSCTPSRRWQMLYQDRLCALSLLERPGEFTGNSRMKMTVSMNPAAGNA